VALTKQRDGRDTITEYVQAGNYVGEMALLAPQETRNDGAKATVKVDTMLLTTEAVVPFLEADPGLQALFSVRASELAVKEAVHADDIERGTVIWLMDNTGAHEATDLLLIDESLCIRCDNCEKACAWTHQGISRLDRESGPTYQTSSGTQLHIPTACQHCENPKCMNDCPPDALRRDRNGEVYIRDNCIGCGNCVSACPYGVIQMAAVDDLDVPGVLSHILFGARPRIIKRPEDKPANPLAVKCDLCRTLPEPRVDRPRAACVASCPTGAIVRVKPRDLVTEIVERE
jgi:Fe-S-cluster-containing dehydrogenase component